MRHLIDFRPAAGLMLVPPLLLPGYDHLEHPSKHVPRAAAVLCFLSAPATARRPCLAIIMCRFHPIAALTTLIPPAISTL